MREIFVVEVSFLSPGTELAIKIGLKGIRFDFFRHGAGRMGFQSGRVLDSDQMPEKLRENKALAVKVEPAHSLQHLKGARGDYTGIAAVGAGILVVRLSAALPSALLRTSAFGLQFFFHGNILAHAF